VRGRGSVRPEKAARVAGLRSRLLEAPVAALVGVRGVPASALQTMRRQLRDRGRPIEVAPNSAIRHAIEGALDRRPALRPLLDHVSDQTAVLTADGNPFVLSNELRRTRSPTPARGGEIAPHDIVVPGGATSFKPGPIVGELQQAGFPAAIEKGKVVLKRDVTIVRAGQPIPRAVATLLARLEIFPLEVGLDLRALVDRDTFYPPELLAVDLETRRQEIVAAHRRAFSVALKIAYPTRSTIPWLLARAHRAATALALEAEFPTRATLPALVGKALRRARAVSNLIGASDSSPETKSE
jgi:large subunit ribosomal protein L10